MAARPPPQATSQLGHGLCARRAGGTGRDRAGFVRRHRLRHENAWHGRPGSAAAGEETTPASCGLSLGNAEPENILRTLPVAHQFLSKPCDVECADRHRTSVQPSSLLENDAIRNVIGKLDKLPSAPRSCSGGHPRPSRGPTWVWRTSRRSSSRIRRCRSRSCSSSTRPTSASPTAITSIQQAVLHIGFRRSRGWR